MHSTLDFASVQVRDLQASKDFYTRVIGFEADQTPRPGAVVFRDAGGAVFAIREPLAHTDVRASFGVGVSLWFGVQDADTAHARMAASGATVVSPPQPGPFGRMFVVRDPDGYQLTFHQA